MTYFESFILGFIQGLTEFLPVSSSGHLVLAEHFFNLSFPESTMLTFDVVLHAGTLLALIIYFRKTWKRLIINFFRYFTLEKKDKTEINMLFLATLPVVIFGLGAKDFIESYMRNPLSVLISMLFVAIVLFVAEYLSKQNIREVDFKKAIIIGFSQAIAIFPGVSRSGMTISTAMIMHVKREKAAEFSFILGTIALFGASSYVFLKSLSVPVLISADLMFVGFLSSFFSSLFCVHFLLKFLKNNSLKVFSVYLCILVLISGFFVLN